MVNENDQDKNVLSLQADWCSDIDEQAIRSLSDGSSEWALYRKEFVRRLYREAKANPGRTASRVFYSADESGPGSGGGRMTNTFKPGDRAIHRDGWVVKTEGEFVRIELDGTKFSRDVHYMDLEPTQDNDEQRSVSEQSTAIDDADDPINPVLEGNALRCLGCGENRAFYDDGTTHYAIWKEYHLFGYCGGVGKSIEPSRAHYRSSRANGLQSGAKAHPGPVEGD